MVAEYRWTVIITSTLLALGLFFGFSYYRQRFLMEEPFLAMLRGLEGIEDVTVTRENGHDTLIVTPKAAQSGSLPELVEEIRQQAYEHKQKPLLIRVADARNSRLASFARATGPALYEAARLGSYRAADEAIKSIAAAYGLTGVLFTVDAEYLYLEARDGSAYLYQLIPLNRPGEGGGV
jgi:hypothetical protein